MSFEPLTERRKWAAMEKKISEEIIAQNISKLA